MDSSLKISVVIPAYNAEAFIERSLHSVMRQTYKPSEIIVVDDGSTDKTSEIIKKYGERICYTYKKNGGEASARNFGVNSAKYDWIAFLDSDDEWTADHLGNFAGIISQKPDLMWFGAPIKHVDEISRKILFTYKKRRRNKLIDNIYFEDYLSALPPQGFFSASTMIINKKVFSKLGLFDTAKTTGTDVDMWFRIGLHFPEIGYSQDTGVVVYRRQESLSNSKKWDPELTLARFAEIEEHSKLLGAEYALRAEPRLIYRVNKLLRAAISKSDYAIIKKIKDLYFPRLPFKYQALIVIITVYPGITKFLKALR
ncbi:MAG TPA: glycosyltransferase family 2 protein [Saprospiraceae bacterium]|nr:glycosyltransferase family 2 protein [Saprospiraceae bacterium]